MKIENEHIECKGESVEAEKNNQNQEIDYKLISDNIRRIREEKPLQRWRIFWGRFPEIWE